MKAELASEPFYVRLFQIGEVTFVHLAAMYVAAAFLRETLFAQHTFDSRELQPQLYRPQRRNGRQNCEKKRGDAVHRCGA
jgi:hypothetical protein